MTEVNRLGEGGWGQGRAEGGVWPEEFGGQRRAIKKKAHLRGFLKDENLNAKWMGEENSLPGGVGEQWGGVGVAGPVCRM